MAEVDTKSEIIESKEKAAVTEPENEDGDESKENNDDGDESSENISKSTRTPLKSMPLPLYDSPLAQSGKRVRAQAPQFVIEKKEEFVYEYKGSGVALGEIPFIEHMINREVPDNLKKLHSICFGRTGDRTNVRKNLRQFNGFPFDASDKKYEAKKTTMDRFFKADLGNICKILGLELSGAKNEVLVRILDFVLKPEDNKKNLPEKKKKKSGNKKKKSDKGKKAGRKSKGGDTENDNTANDEDDSSTANDTADSSDSGSGSEAEEKPKKTPAKKPAKTPAKKVATKTPAKKTPAKKTPAKKAPAKRSKDVVDSDSDSSDDEPLIKKTKSAPSNDEIKQKIEKILEGADLEEVSMKSVIKKIYEMYPGFDLTDRKSFIKETVKAIIS